MLDEGHAVKNAASARAKRILSMKVKRRLLLTGTPVQNSVEELVNLLRFVMPTVFKGVGADETNTELARRKEERFMAYIQDGRADSKASSSSSGSSSFSSSRSSPGGAGGGGEKGGGNEMTRLKKMLAPFVLRRLKNDVLGELVPKKEATEKVQSSARQQALYDSVVAHAKRSLAEKKAAKLKGGKAARTKSLTSVFTDLRKVANHPLLLDNQSGDFDTHYSRDLARLKEIAMKMHRFEVFGDQCSQAMVEVELAGYSDFAIHMLCDVHSDLDQYVLGGAEIIHRNDMGCMLF